MAIERFSLVAPTSVRGPGQAVGSDSDQRYLNCFVDVMGNATEGKPVEEPYIAKRPGVAQLRDLADGEGRGIIEFQGFEYAVIGNTVFKDGVSIGTLTTSTGRVAFAKANDGTGLLLINDKTNLYSINPADTITNLTTADPQIPTPTVFGVEVFDQFAFLLNVGGQVHNSDVGDVTSWQGDFITLETVADDGTRLVRHLDYLLGFGTESIEVLFDAANATGSPLQKYQGVPTLHGSPAAETVQRLDQIVIYVGERPNGGGRFVGMFGGSFTYQSISTRFVEEALEGEGSTIGDAFAFFMRIMGHDFYILQLPTTQDITLVFDLTTGMWYQWSDTAGTGHWPYVDAAEVGGTLRLLHESTGQIVVASPDTYQDLTVNFPVQGRMRKHDQGVLQQKFAYSLRMVADLAETSTNLSIDWSDDDYQTYHATRTLDISREGNQLTRLGSYTRRAYRWTLTENIPWRAQAFEFNVERGHYKGAAA